MRWLRFVLLALLLSLSIGLAIGTVIRLRMEKPVRYIGRSLPRAGETSDPSHARVPLDIGNTATCVLQTRSNEEQV